MTKNEPSFEDKKHEMSVKSMNFSRYMMIRYFSAIYLFTNLFWLIFSISYKNIFASVVSGILFLLIIAASIEQATKWHTKSTELKLTTTFYVAQLVMNIFFAAICYTPIGKVFFPFMVSNDVANIIFTIQLLGLIGCILVLKRISNIHNGHDKYIKAIETFEKNKQ